MAQVRVQYPIDLSGLDSSLLFSVSLHVEEVARGWIKLLKKEYFDLGKYY